jgi:hypothetical protein
MKFAFLIMYELRAIKTTIDNIKKYIIDFYDADIFIICQKTFDDDEENIKLFGDKVIFYNFYEKINPVKYYGESISNVKFSEWKRESNMQTYINETEASKIIEKYIDEYDYFITIRSDSFILFPFPDKAIWSIVPPGIYTIDAKYCKSWGGFSAGVFIHKNFIIDYLKRTYEILINPKYIDKIVGLNQEAFVNLCAHEKNLKFNLIKELNFFWTADFISGRTTWSLISYHDNYNVLYKYGGQLDEAFHNYELWKQNYEWSYDNNIIKLNKVINKIIN